MTSKIVVNNIEADAGVSTVTISSDVTATSFSGDGSNLTSLPAQATISNNADNRVITGGSGVNLNGEANLTFSSNQLTVHEAKLKGNQLLFTTSGTAYLDHSTVGQDIQVRVSTSSSQDTTGPTFKSNGNFAVASGKGIDYTAQTATAVSGATATGEVFDHYEEGTWTATLGNVNAPTYEAQGGVYTRIGRMVFCDCTIGVASGLDTSDGSGFQIRGLPFTGSVAGGTVCLFSLGRYTNLLGGKATAVRNVRFLGDGVILQEGNDSDIAYNECSSSGYLQISFAYHLA